MRRETPRTTPTPAVTNLPPLAALAISVEPVSARETPRPAILAARLYAESEEKSAMAPPFDARDVFAAARSGDRGAQSVVAEVARRIVIHIWPLGAVADVGLVVLGGGIGANGDLLLEPVRELLAVWLPYPPRVEISSLGEAAVLTGALAVGLRSALDNVFAQRRPATMS